METQNLTINENQIDAKPNRNHKDSLFRFIFSGEDDRSKRWLLSLYNALNDTNYTDINELKITTLENALFLEVKEDLSFLIDSEMNLFEHQSSVNPNMPLRGLMYFAKLYQTYLAKKNEKLYGSSIVKIPTPKYFVFYNGTKEQDDIIKYRLSDAFEKPSEAGEFEWTCTVLNINAGRNPALQKRCKALYDYSSFIANVQKRILDDHQDPNEAIMAAVDDAINDRLLDGLFKEQKQGVLGKMFEEFDREIYEKTIRNEGAQQKAIEAAKNFLRLNTLSFEQIADSLGLPVETVEEIAKNQTHVLSSSQ